MRFLITGTAGFIGFHLARNLIKNGHFIYGYDGMTHYYDVRLKEKRIDMLSSTQSYRHQVGMLEDLDTLKAVADEAKPDVIIHLAAQAGVRYSLEHPEAYVSANLVGTFNVLEIARMYGPKHLMLASTSSVYGGNEKMPFSEQDHTDLPMTLYAATKKSNEVMSHSYSHLWGVATTCFRFFTVYGPWGRPDMALFKFVDAIENGREVEIYGEGRMRRDFTYVDDLAECISRLVDVVPERGKPVEVNNGADSLSPVAPWRVVNIAGGSPVELMDYVAAIEKHLGTTARKKFLPMQKGDVPATSADVSLLYALTGHLPSTGIDVGVGAFVEWYRSYWKSR